MLLRFACKRTHNAIFFFLVPLKDLRLRFKFHYVFGVSDYIFEVKNFRQKNSFEQVDVMMIDKLIMLFDFKIVHQTKFIQFLLCSICLYTLFLKDLFSF